MSVPSHLPLHTPPSLKSPQPLEQPLPFHHQLTVFRFRNPLSLLRTCPVPFPRTSCPSHQAHPPERASLLPPAPFPHIHSVSAEQLCPPPPPRPHLLSPSPKQTLPSSTLPTSALLRAHRCRSAGRSADARLRQSDLLVLRSGVDQAAQRHAPRPRLSLSLVPAAGRPPAAPCHLPPAAAAAPAARLR